MFTGEFNSADYAREMNQASKGISDSNKRRNATRYIYMLRDIYFGETMPTKESALKDGTILNVKILPYESIKTLWNEYIAHCEIHKISEHERAELTCFTAAFKKLERANMVRLLHCKGSFPTCDICNKVRKFIYNLILSVRYLII